MDQRPWTQSSDYDLNKGPLRFFDPEHVCCGTAKTAMVHWAMSEDRSMGSLQEHSATSPSCTWAWPKWCAICGDGGAKRGGTHRCDA